MSQFDPVSFAQVIEQVELCRKANEDVYSLKVALGTGVYRTDEGITWILPVVKKVEKLLALQPDVENLQTINKCTQLSDEFCTLSIELAYGKNSNVLLDGKVFGIQSLGGTCPLRLGADFLATQLNLDTVYIPNPSWDTHLWVFQKARFKTFHTYRYWDEDNKCVDFNGLITDLEHATVNSVVVLHACAHNPTGVDPTKEQWKKIAQIMKHRHLYPYFDMAYQGFASGDIDEDAWSLRYFAESGLELMCIQSFSKTFGLYGERVGCLSLVTTNPNNIERCKSQLNRLVRGMYNNPNKHGAKIVAMILKDEDLRKEWLLCLKVMNDRIKEMRSSLRYKLEKQGTPGSWNHITDQVGMFSYTGLTVSQCRYLVEERRIYLLSSGRINISGLTTKNIDYVVKCIHEVIVDYPTGG